MKKCRYCGSQNDDDSLFCSECGKKMHQGRVCPYCGSGISDDDVFCANCGKKVKELLSPDALVASQRKCHNCGMLLDQDDVFCPNCGIKLREPELFEKVSKPNTIKYIPICLVIALLLGGGFWYWKKNQCSIIETEIEVNKNNDIDSDNSKESKEFVSIETILEMYKNKDKNYIIKLLKEKGYELYKSDKHVEYWTKDVQLKEVENYNGTISYDPLEAKGSCVQIYSSDEWIELSVAVYTENDFKEWVKQLNKLGFRENSYGENIPMEDGWTRVGAHSNLCKLYKDENGNSIEFMKNGDGHPGFSVFDIEFAHRDNVEEDEESYAFTVPEIKKGEENEIENGGVGNVDPCDRIMDAYENCTDLCKAARNSNDNIEKTKLYKEAYIINKKLVADPATSECFPNFSFIQDNLEYIEEELKELGVEL